MAPAISCVMLFQQAPLTVRQLCQDTSAGGADLEQVLNLPVGSDAKACLEVMWSQLGCCAAMCAADGSLL